MTREEKQMADFMINMARDINLSFNGQNPDTPAVGFVLMVFPYDSPDMTTPCNFVTNGTTPADLLVLFKSMVAKLEGQPETVGHA